MNALTSIDQPTEKVLPSLDPTKASAMKRVCVAVDAARVAKQVSDWGAPRGCDKAEDAVWYYLRDSVVGQTVTDRHLATEDFIFSRLPAGADTDIRAMPIDDRRELFGAIYREAKAHEARYRRDFARAAK